MAGADFVQVQLSAAGVKMAGAGAVVRVVKAQSDFVFKAGVPQRVTLAWEWAKLLAPMKYQGQPIFEIVAATAAPATAGTAAVAAASAAAPSAPATVAPNHPAKIWPKAPAQVPAPAPVEEKR